MSGLVGGSVAGGPAGRRCAVPANDEVAGTTRGPASGTTVLRALAASALPNDRSGQGN